MWEKKKTVEGEWSEIETHEQETKADAPVHKPQKITVVLEKEHERFYDKLRSKVEEFLKRQTRDRADAAAKYILLAPDLFVLLARLLQDKRVSAKSKALAGLAVAYFISPVDIIPELLTGPIGYLDDIILAAYVLNKMINDVEQSVIAEHWNGDANLLDTIQELLRKAEDLVDSKVLGLIKKVLNK
jgi:uncharacterized membrane protein YkvA (DUF1232 family)